MSNRDDHYFIYIKDSNNKHTGITICVMSKEGKLWHGQANCSKSEQFCKKIGRELAYKRAIEDFEKNKKNKQEPVKVEKSVWVETSQPETTFYNVEKKQVDKNTVEIKLKTNKELDPYWVTDNELIGTYADTGSGITVNFDGEEHAFDYTQWEYLQMFNKLIGREVTFKPLNNWDRTIP